MKKKFHLFLLLFFVLAVSCNTDRFTSTQAGIEVSPDSGEKIRLDVITEDIIHVRATTEKTFSGRNSLMVVKQPDATVEWKAEKVDGNVILSTSKIKAIVSLTDGTVKFETADGIQKLAEKNGGGKFFSPNPADAGLYHIRQVFESPQDEALYGLGQHQNGQMNYKGEDVEMWQYNSVAVVPFLYSSKNYGILWDNYSRSRFGDMRDYQPLSTLSLFDAQGNEGGLTASYIHFDSETPVLTRQESTIQYENLEELPNVPSEFNLANGFVRWEGSVASDIGGKHKLKLWSSGYFKIWIDGELKYDLWRQGWNPWYDRLIMDMEAGEKKQIKIEWTPDSGMAFIAVTALTPLDETEQQQISLYSEAGREIDYYFINGENADEVIKGYRALTGKSPILPKWAFGFWQSRERYRNQEDLLNVVREYRKRNIPLDNIVLDWQYWHEHRWGDHTFDEKFFPQPNEMIRELHEDLNAHIMISVWPKYNQMSDNYKIMESKGYLYPRSVEVGNKDWVGPGYLSTFYDAFNEGARVEFWNQLRDSLYKRGIDGWWLDAVEPDIHSNVSWEEKKLLMSPLAIGTAEEYFNAYSLVQAGGVHDGQRKDDPDNRVFILTRSAYAGQQRYSAVTWSGDVVSRWHDFERQIPAGTNISISGIPFWTMDIGGFAVERRYDQQDPAHQDEWRELNTRWFQFGAFCPLFRSHGQFPYREIFNIAPENTEYYNSMVWYTNLRYRLMPYIYSMAGWVYTDDYTMMRPLVMDFAHDTKALNIHDSYMFGPSFLVAPVYSYKARTKEVYLPSGTGWYDFYTGTYNQGGQSIQANAPVDRMPLFVKEGSIIPMGPVIQHTAQEYTEPVTLYVFTGKDAQFTLYEDEGTNTHYEKGEMATINFTYNEADKTLTIGAREGSFNGMKENRQFSIIVVNKNNPVPFALEQKATGEPVNYNGAEVKITL